ncbi:MAG: RluA family pseudouridine synthase [Granulosicoccus sp.]
MLSHEENAVMGNPKQVSKSRHVGVDEDSAEQRIDNFLVRHCPGVPRSHLYQLIRKGKVLVNGRRIRQTRKLQIGEKVRIPELTVSSASVTKVPGKLQELVQRSIILRHEDFFVLNKPPGLAVHAGTGLAFGLIDALRQQQGSDRLELAHRLDRATSGCLLVGRNPRVTRQLQDLFRKRLIEKTYLALVDGNWPESCRTVSLPLLKNTAHAGERRVVVDKRGQPSTTHIKVVGRVDEASLLEVSLETGRTHQIRVHTSHKGHGIVGDTRYGDNRRNAFFKRQGLSRLFLHACELSFEWCGEPVRIHAGTDDTWNAGLRSLQLSEH